MASKIGEFFQAPFRHPVVGALSPFEKGCCAVGTGVSAYAVAQLAKTTAIVGARAGVGCMGAGYTSFLVPLSKATITLWKDGGAGMCSSEVNTFLVCAVGLVTAGVVGYKLFKKWPNLVVGPIPAPPSGPRPAAVSSG